VRRWAHRGTGFAFSVGRGEGWLKEKKAAKENAGKIRGTKGPVDALSNDF